METKSVILDQMAVQRTLTRVAHEIIERNKGVEDIVLIGIKRRGYPIAKRLAELIYKFEEVNIPTGSVDITFYRDDLSTINDQPVLKSEDINVEIKDKKVILVDDVLYTGRTARAAIDAVIHQGRPMMIQLAVLVDRGHRELPIRADYVGKNIPTSKEEMVAVELMEIDGADSVQIVKK